MHMICNSTDAERLYFILLCDSTHERPKSFLDFAHQQRFANRCAHLHESHRTLRDGSFGVALSQALRARLRSHRPSGTFRNSL